MKVYIIFFFMLFSHLSFSSSLSKSSKGSKFNPDIGLNALMLYKNSAKDDSVDGFAIQELELQFSSDVDTYFRGEATLAIHQETSIDAAGVVTSEYHLEPEEAFLETISLPNLTIKFGKFYADFGKYNAIHTHALPFIYRNILHEKILGDEGLNEVGIGVSGLVPLPWFSEITFQALQATNSSLFAKDRHSLAYTIKSKNLWELSDNLTLEWGLSGLTFSNNSSQDKTTLLGSDLTFKWKPSEQGKYHSFIWSSEFIHKEQTGSTNDRNAGIITFIRHQLSERFFTQAKYEFLGLTKNIGTKDTNAYTALVAFVPTEFSSIRLQYDQIHTGTTQDEKRLSLQLNYSIGAHPAHQY